MDTPRRTIQELEALGDREVRGCYKRLMELLIERERWVMQAVIESVDRRIAADWPQGIPSEIESGECAGPID